MFGEASPYAEHWGLAKELFPQWVGFRDERCRPHAELLERFRQAALRGELETQRVIDLSGSGF